MKRQILTEEEKQIERDIEKGLYVSVKDFKGECEMIKQAIKNKYDKKIISLRVANSDLNKIKAKALEQWLPYQTLINSIIHKYTNHIYS